MNKKYHEALSYFRTRLLKKSGGYNTYLEYKIKYEPMKDGFILLYFLLNEHYSKEALHL